MSRVHALLAKRHADAVYVPECKMGAAGTRTLDAWVMLPTWSPFTTIGYEVKVTRSDWTRDQKFLEYRPVCHLLMVAAEPGVVQPSELPAGVGLLEAAGKGDGGRLVMRVKPARAEPDHAKLVSLMAHVLMWRVRVQHRNDRTESKADRVQHWREYLADRREWRDVGYQVRGKMRAKLTEAFAERDAAKLHAERLAEAAAILQQMGIASLSYGVRYQVERALRDGGQDVSDAIGRAIASLTTVKTSVDAALGERHIKAERSHQ